jgi:hypothetical protein
LRNTAFGHADTAVNHMDHDGSIPPEARYNAAKATEGDIMLRAIGFGLAATVLLASPSHAITTPKEKMVTCKFGADDQKLAGKARNTFLSRCMAKSDGPAARAKPKAQPQ